MPSSGLLINSNNKRKCARDNQIDDDADYYQVLT